MKIQARGEGGSMVHLSPGELRSLLRCARAKGIREWAMLLLAYKHGMRASEILATSDGPSLKP